MHRGMIRCAYHITIASFCRRLHTSFCGVRTQGKQEFYFVYAPVSRGKILLRRRVLSTKKRSCLPKRDFGEAVTTYIIVLASMSQIFDNFFLLMGLFVGVFGEHTDRRLGYNMVRRVSPHSVINCRVGKTKTKKPNTKTIVAYTCTTLADRTKSEPDAPPTADRPIFS